ncbi:CGL73 [Auxenochlorella protothecoides x Auxenochlorella symbiontica]
MAHTHMLAPQTVAVQCLQLRPSAAPFSTVRPAGAQQFSRVRLQGSRRPRRPAAGSSVGSGWMDMPESTPLPEDIQVFPRLKERDPYKLLGVDRQASYEEVQEARNYLFEIHKHHAPSRESIELALDSILTERMKWRHKHGFQPPQRGRKTDALGEERVSLWQRVRSAVEPSVPVSTLVNDGTVFLVLAVWAGWQSLAAEPTLPLCGALAYAVWKLYDKRTRRDPDGPFFGGNAIWGALAAGMAGLVLGGFAVFGAVRFMPIPASVGTGAPFAFLLVLLLGVIALYIR